VLPVNLEKTWLIFLIFFRLAMQAYCKQLLIMDFIRSFIRLVYIREKELHQMLNRLLPDKSGEVQKARIAQALRAFLCLQKSTDIYQKK